MYEAKITDVDGVEHVGWMGSGLPQKKGFHSIKLEAAGIQAFIPDEEVKEMQTGKVVKLDDITIKAPEKTPGDTGPVNDGNPMAGVYQAPQVCKPGSKLDKIRILMDNNPGLSRAEYIEKVVEAGLGTPKGASTYLNNAKPFVQPETLSGWKSKKK
jgi:hypothetical protein